jgi:hypothetical protein
MRITPVEVLVPAPWSTAGLKKAESPAVNASCTRWRSK